jgi:hypothetical protein
MRKLVELIRRDYHGVFDYRIERREGKLWPRCTVPEEAEEQLRHSWGKTALITGLSEEGLSKAALVDGYVARAAPDDDFKWLKDRGVMSVKPVWVWDEAEIRAHMSLCVMGRLLYRLLQWKVRDLGLSMKELVEVLEGIRVGALRTSSGDPQFVVEEMTREQARLFSCLRLGDRIPHETGGSGSRRVYRNLSRETSRSIRVRSKSDHPSGGQPKFPAESWSSTDRRPRFRNPPDAYLHSGPLYNVP